jgi:hypothetical protein
MLILAIIFGCASLVLTVFGAWPALLLVLASGVVGALAVSKIKKYKPRARPRKPA